MTKTRIFLLLLLFLLGSSVQSAQTTRDGKGAGGTNATNNKPLIGSIKKDPFQTGCGCGFSLKGNPKRTIFTDDFNGNVWMNIDGRDVKLKLSSRVEKGRKTTYKYTAAGISVRVEALAGKSYGEGSDQTGTITVTKSTRQQTVSFVGVCGC